MKILLLAMLSLALHAAEVSLQRVPNGGIQPQALVDAKGRLHLIYFKGEASNGDIYYVHSDDGGTTFSAPLQVNSQAGSAMAIGNIRGAHLALGKSQRVHVAWMGSNSAVPRGPAKESPMLYTRLNDAGTVFEEQRNVIAAHYGLDGGGTVAADSMGNVYVLWHGQGEEKGEEHRRVWLARSSDEGKTFAAESAAWKNETGACGCCGMGALADSEGNLFVLYRAAYQKMNRGMYLLTCRAGDNTFHGMNLDQWEADKCPMSTSSLSTAGTDGVMAWENKGQIYYWGVDPAGNSKPLTAPGVSSIRKHPSIAINAAGEMLLAWTEGMGWAKGGTLHWQLYDKSGQQLQNGDKGTVPTWSLVAAVSKPGGGFLILY